MTAGPDQMRDAICHARTELARADTKTGMYLGLTSAAAAGAIASIGWSATSGMPLSAKAPAVATAALVLVCLGIAAHRLRHASTPMLGGDHGIVRYNRAVSLAELDELVATEDPRAVVWWTAQTAVARHVQVSSAVRALWAALPVAVVGAAVTGVAALLSAVAR